MTSISANGATETIYITDVEGTLYYRRNNGSLTTFTWPVTITNSNISAVLKVIFLTDLTLNTNTNQYFACGSSNIQFGDTSLSATGSRRTITVDINFYDGFISNGDSGVPGYDNIYIYNLSINGSGGSLQIGAGWLAKQYFGNAASECFIVNCSSTGNMSDQCGGIAGRYGGSGSGGSLTIRGCSSSGSMTQLSGGIMGSYAGSNGGSVICEQCFSTGVIGDFAGGIFGDYAGDGGSASASKCYSTGSIGVSSGNAGGIYGRYGGNNGSASASQCYSQGSVAADGGGIYGLGAASDAGLANATNCYSSGSIVTTGNGIFGTGKAVGGTTSQCYSANGSWSDATANTNLTGVPGASGVGTAWISTGTNQPYELNGIGYTPYGTTVIDSSSELIQTYSQTVDAGNSTTTARDADASGNSFTILQKSGGDAGSHATITMSAQTGAISTTSATLPGTYTITLRSIGSYHITTFILTVSPDAVPAGAVTACCVTTINERGLDYAQITNYRIGNRLLLEVSQNSKTKFDGYSQYVKYKMAQGSRKV